MNKKTNFFVAFLFIVTLICTGFIRMHLKSMPQIIMLIFGAITLFLLTNTQLKVTRLFFYILFIILVFNAFYSLTNMLIDLINPERGYVKLEGNRYRVMDANWIWAIITGLILTPITVILYYKKKMHNNFLEITFVSLFLATTALIFMVYEIF